MGLFDQILGAIDNPQQQANPNQIGDILNTTQQLSNNYGADPSSTQSALSIVGNYVRSALQQKQATQGYGEAQSIVNQFGGTSPNNFAVQALFSAPQVQQIVQEVSQRTGLNPGVIQSMLPILVPIVLNLLKSGSQTGSAQGNNNVLSTFLDADGDGDVDIADAMQMAGRYMNR